LPCPDTTEERAVQVWEASEKRKKNGVEFVGKLMPQSGADEEMTARKLVADIPHIEQYAIIPGMACAVPESSVRNCKLRRSASATPALTRQVVMPFGGVTLDKRWLGWLGRDAEWSTDVRSVIYDGFFNLIRGLKTLADGGVSHMDIKLNNIVWSSSADRQTKFIDFGRAQPLNKVFFKDALRRVERRTWMPPESNFGVSMAKAILTRSKHLEWPIHDGPRDFRAQADNMFATNSDHSQLFSVQHAKSALQKYASWCLQAQAQAQAAHVTEYYDTPCLFFLNYFLTVTCAHKTDVYSLGLALQEFASNMRQTQQGFHRKSGDSPLLDNKFQDEALLTLTKWMTHANCCMRPTPTSLQTFVDTYSLRAVSDAEELRAYKDAIVNTMKEDAKKIERHMTSAQLATYASQWPHFKASYEKLVQDQQHRLQYITGNYLGLYM
jgi:hypothetical protein